MGNEQNIPKIFAILFVIFIIGALYSFLIIKDGFLFVIFLILGFISYIPFSRIGASEMANEIKRIGYEVHTPGNFMTVPVYTKKVGPMLFKLRAGTVRTGRSNTGRMYQLFLDTPTKKTFSLYSKNYSEIKNKIFEAMNKLEGKNELPKELDYIRNIPELNNLPYRWELEATEKELRITVIKSFIDSFDVASLIHSEEKALLAVYKSLKKN